MAEMREETRWAVERLTAGLVRILGAMTDLTPEASANTSRGRLALDVTPSEEGFFWWEESFVGAENARLWFGCPRRTWMEIGGRTLRAAGLEEVAESDARNTFIETLNQLVSDLQRAIQERGIGEFVRAPGREVDDDPDTEDVAALTVQYPEQEPLVLFAVFSPEFIGMLDSEDSDDATLRQIATRPGGPSQDPLNSRTMDLLMEVELPVSVSFGRTHLPIKEVMRLSSGAIVELNRALSEPVEVIVNNCVIARGEVVVIDGNYGVRINQIVSVQERLRTLN